MLLVPRFVFENVTAITPEFLAEHHIKGLVLDIDNTLALHDDPVLRPDISEWLNVMRQNAIQLIVASNNGKERVSAFAGSNSLPYVFKAHKPLSKGFSQAQQCFQLPRSQMAVVGDQLFTDRLGAALFGCEALVTLPLGPETKWYIKLKRVLEKPFFAAFYRMGGHVIHG